ncbi:hypothetical protein ACWFR0_37220, partial [Streptomyces noursei]
LLVLGASLLLLNIAVGATTGRTAHAPEGWPHHPPRPHTSRTERTPVTPTGSRRPPHADRVPRGAAPFGPTGGRPRNGTG